MFGVPRWVSVWVACGTVAAAGVCAHATGAPQRSFSSVMANAAVTYRAVSFAELPGWQQDNHVEALAAFVKSCERIAAVVKSGTLTVKTIAAPEVLAACLDAASALGPRPDVKKARRFFESHFVPHRVMHAGSEGLLTGYYEPLLEGSRAKGGAFQVPVYRRPTDLVTIIDETQGSAKPQAMTHAMATASGLKPFPTRSEIDSGALAGRGLELIYMKDSVDLFFMQIQGSGRIRLPNGEIIRVHYDGKNGHPYTSIGRYLIDNKIMAADKVSLEALARWLRADPERGRKVMAQNASYVFFRELKGKEAASAIGVLDIPLTPGRSLAVDAAIHTVGLPMFVSAGTLTHGEKGAGFHRLMVAQDVGSAIKGPERGDIFFGSGDAAGKLAGTTKHPGNLYVLLPAQQVRADAGSTAGPKLAKP